MNDNRCHFEHLVPGIAGGNLGYGCAFCRKKWEGDLRDFYYHLGGLSIGAMGPCLRVPAVFKSGYDRLSHKLLRETCIPPPNEWVLPVPAPNTANIAGPAQQQDAADND